MSDQSLDITEAATDAQTDQIENQAREQVKTYTQEEFDRHMAGLKNSIAKKYERQFSELGDLDELRKLKEEHEVRKQQEAIKRGEFEKTLQELAQKKDAEIQKRDSIIKEYKVNTPILDAAARYKSINPVQVKQLLSSNVRLNEEGDVEVVDEKGSVRYNDSGAPLGVDDLVKEFLDTNPHFKQASAATTNTKSNVSPAVKDFDISKLDMKNPEHRRMYAEWKNKA